MTEHVRENRIEILRKELDKVEKEAIAEFDRLTKAHKQIQLERDACFLHYRQKLKDIRTELEELGAIPPKQEIPPPNNYV